VGETDDVLGHELPQSLGSQSLHKFHALCPTNNASASAENRSLALSTVSWISATAIGYVNHGDPGSCSHRLSDSRRPGPGRIWTGTISQVAGELFKTLQGSLRSEVKVPETAAARVFPYLPTSATFSAQNYYAAIFSSPPTAAKSLRTIIIGRGGKGGSGKLCLARLSLRLPPSPR